MIKGLIITPPVLGRISIGGTIEKNGKRLPTKDDQFTITSQVQGKEGWINHPLDAKFREQSDGKLRKIPVRMLFNEPELNLRAEYTLFDRQTGRPVCVGDGESCKRRTKQGVETHPCPSPEMCTLAKGGACKPYGRLYVNISEDDELGSFVFRTTGFNSIRTLAARLNYFSAVSNNKLSCLPLQLTLRGKSTTQSYRTPIYYVDLTLEDGITILQAVEQAQTMDNELKSYGFNQQALDMAAKQGYGNSELGFADEDTIGVVDEFYPEPIENNDLDLKAQSKGQDVVQFADIASGLRQSVSSVN
ncbi:hydrolase or metal-binding protein [Psychrobacter raelei]|uniref:Hydrolase or metal-binding protein n=1 Tax=Psychrobacter raelei TaxID=2565531 RepID=A0AAT9PEL6_9GAMM|nr:hydrolase or metal-binding protein [Psychrobacter sp. PraFG1]UNK04914.1 hydrolase or metal-binding protein [Psychrobacter sp. PraFG1]